ncbi:hypothetical protein Hdeb2414_s0024g00655241 [Helianthus debilis subsp. tardiflorus]
MAISTRICIKRSYATSCVAYPQTPKTPPIQQPHNVNPFNMFQLKGPVKAGRLSDARQLFDKLPQRDQVTRTTLISAYADSSESCLSFPPFTGSLLT